MTDTRYSAEELRQIAADHQAVANDFRSARQLSGTAIDLERTAAMLRQAARDAETLAGIRAWLEKERNTNFSNGWSSCAELALAELDRLSRGDA